MPRRWYLVHAQSGKERLAEQHLLRQRYETFLPLIQRTVRHARKLAIGESAYFPGYLFVALDPEVDQWRSINGTIGVIRLVTSNGAPAHAPDDFVALLQAAANARGVVSLMPHVRVGDRVRVAAGIFADELGVVEVLSPAERVRVLLNIMNRMTRVELPLESCAVA
jgi:transcriptional antiterminator RfaH